jgi:predicted metalloendopeptidase
MSAVCVAAVLACGLASAVHAQPVDESGVDASVKPGDDFFAYANGAWLKATEIPAGKERVNVRTEIDALTRARVATLLDDAGAAPAGTIARKVADFRAAYLNEATIEAKGIAPLKPQFDSIDRVQDKDALTRLLGKGLRADVDPLNWGVYDSSHVLGLSVTEGNNGEPTYVAFLLQGGLGLPDRDSYLSTDPRMQALRATYKAYIASMLTLAM